MLERWIRGIAGTMVLLGTWLAYVHSPMWLLLPVAMGANLLQSAFTNWCPMMPILRAMGIDGKI